MDRSSPPSPARLPVGKIPADLLAALLARSAPSRPDPALLLGPRPGEDAAAVRVGDRAVVLATDPVTFATVELGWYAVHVNANDVAVCGAVPRWFLATVLLPEDAPPALPLAITDQIVAACAEVGATLIGGHTEVTAGLPRPIVSGMMVGEVAAAGLITTGGARPGDALLLTRGIAIEGTALIATEFASAVDAVLGAEIGRRCRDFLRAPGLSVVAAARVAAQAGVHALHDPTEGGLATALHELADAAGCGLLLDAEAVPIYPETRALCAHFGLDPLGLLASGALLIAADPARAPRLQADLAAAGIPAAIIGQTLPAGEGRRVRQGAATVELPRFARDEVARLFA
jgi:hydrogenase expression/formation protein HypE